MRKWLVLIFGIFLVFGFVGVDKVLGCSCADSSCTCSPSACGALIETNCNSITTWYHNDSADNSWPWTYSGEKYANQRTFTDSNCEQDGTCDCNCGENGCSTCTDYSCKYYTTTCYEWEDCHSPRGCGNTGSCTCNVNYCKGWCKHKAATAKNEIPVYDGPDFASCSGPSGDCNSLGVEAGKYKRKDSDDLYHESTTCTCSWCEINNFYECDSSLVDDSHPCASGNCAPDFAGGRNYCCGGSAGSYQCAHKGEFSLGTPAGKLGDVYCFNSKEVIQYQGYKLKCNNGNWEFIGGEKNDFTDNCGKTIFNYKLFFNINNFYPSGYGYKNSYAIYPVSFEGTKDVVAYVTPAEDFVEIGINGKSNSGDEQVLKEKTTSPQLIKFLGNEEGKEFGLTVNCYTPNKSACNPSHEDCWPGSYCSQDNPTNIILESNSDIKSKFKVRFLNDANITCYLATEKNKKPDTPFLDETNKDLTGEYELTLDEYNVISCKVITNKGKSGFDSALTKYFNFGDDDGSMLTKDKNCEANTKWKHSITAPEKDGKKWYEYDYDDSGWGEGNQPLGSYDNATCLPRPSYPTYSWYCNPLTKSNCNSLPNSTYCYWDSGKPQACTQDLLKNPRSTLYLRKKIEPNYLFFCCPNNSCAHDGDGKVCWEEGSYRLNISGEVGTEKDPEGCLWNCKNNKWGKQLEGAECKKDCDCAQDTVKTKCVGTLYNLSKKMCCPVGQCGLDIGTCVPEGYKAEAGKYKGCVCNDKSGWDCMKTKLETHYSRVLFSKNANKYETTLEVKKTELKGIDSANAKVLVFFDKGNYNGNIEIKGSGDCYSVYINQLIGEKITKDLGLISTTEGFNCKLEITTSGMNKENYFFYTGSALILEYT